MPVHVRAAVLYQSHNTARNESSPAPSLASLSAHSLPAVVRRPASLSLARYALVRWALHFVTESTCASSPMSRKRCQTPRHTSARGLRPAVHHFSPRMRPRSTAAQSEMKAAPGSDRIKACSKAQSSARMMRRCTGGMAPCAEHTSS